MDVYTPRYNYSSSGFNQASLANNQPFTGAATSNVYGLTVKNTSRHLHDSDLRDALAVGVQSGDARGGLAHAQRVQRHE